MTAISRGAPTFALPATQNTAPVHEFRCLYTHDIRKKAKKWHDGSAKFHTFNKRVMVYDDTKNYIGDLHYRADEEFGEGVELQLDRGVLVEVGELIGHTQTDLTGVVHKPQKDAFNPSIASTNLSSRPPSRINYSNTEGRPKSLAELLGPTQGRLGRAKLSLTSPFEQRQILSDVQQNERPSKRQKVALGKENHGLFDYSPASVRLQRKSSPAGPVAITSTISRVSDQQHLATETTSRRVDEQLHVIDISSDEEAPVRSRPSSGRSHNHTQKTLCADKQQGIRETNGGQKGDCKPRSTRQETGTPARPRKPRTNTPMQAYDNASTGSGSLLNPGMSSLKMRSQEPRQKLMYKALLPSSEMDLGEKAGSVNNPDQGDPNGDGEISDQSLDTPAVEAVPNGTIELQGLKGSPSRTPSTPVRDRAHEVPAKPTSVRGTVSHSPLFISQSDSQRSSTPVSTFIADGFDIIGTQNILNDSSATMEAPDPLLLAETDETDNLEPESPCFPCPPPRTEPVQQSVLKVMTASKDSSVPFRDENRSRPVRRTPSPVKSRSLIRSLSSNDSPFTCDPRASPAHRPDLEPVEKSPLAAAQRRTPLVTSLLPNTTLLNDRATPTKSSLQRCRSDTAAIIPTVSAAAESPSITATADEQGPWTKLEAFLLFDRWPMCKLKDKPVFEPLSTQEAGDADEDGSADEGMKGFVSAAVVGRNGPSVLIRSARALLRDAQACGDRSVYGR